jgi:hypothetical protein
VGVEILPGTDAFQLHLKEIEARALDFMPAMPAMAEVFYQAEKQVFAEEGPSWAPLADSTIIRKQGLSDEMMVRGDIGSEGLKQSLTSHSAHSVYRATPLSLDIGTSVSYAAFHQEGAEGFSPIRKIVPGISSSNGFYMVATWFEILQNYLVHGIAGKL